MNIRSHILLLLLMGMSTLYASESAQKFTFESFKGKDNEELEEYVENNRDLKNKKDLIDSISCSLANNNSDAKETAKMLIDIFLRQGPGWVVLKDKNENEEDESDGKKKEKDNGQNGNLTNFGVILKSGVEDGVDLKKNQALMNAIQESWTVLHKEALKAVDDAKLATLESMIAQTPSLVNPPKFIKYDTHFLKSV